MKSSPALLLALFIGASLACGQGAETGGTVIATFDDGVTMTLDEYQTLLRVNPEWQGQPREQVLSKYATLRKAAALAKSQKLDQKSPYKDSLEFATIVALAGIEVREATSTVAIDPAEIAKFYDEHKEPFKIVRISGIQIAFEGPQSRTREQARSKAEQLAAQIRAGADFAGLVARESDDPASKNNGGYIATWRVADNVPADLRAAVFSLKQGEVSDPLPQSNSYYLIRADSVTYPPLSEVRDTILTQLKKERTEQWIRDLEGNTKVTFPPRQDPPGSTPPPPAQ